MKKLAIFGFILCLFSMSAYSQTNLRLLKKEFETKEAIDLAEDQIMLGQVVYTELKSLKLTNDLREIRMTYHSDKSVRIYNKNEVGFKNIEIHFSDVVKAKEFVEGFELVRKTMDHLQFDILLFDNEKLTKVDYGTRIKVKAGDIKIRNNTGLLTSAEGLESNDILKHKDEAAKVYVLSLIKRGLQPFLSQYDNEDLPTKVQLEDYLATIDYWEGGSLKEIANFTNKTVRETNKLIIEKTLENKLIQE